MKNLIKKTLVVVLAITALHTNLTAQTTTPQLKQVSNINNQPVFELQLNNDENDVVYVVIKDAVGTTLHKEKITEKRAIRNYALDSDAFSVASTLIFDIQSVKNKTTASFEVKNNNSISNDLAVVSLVK
jgi:hypothetical protein